MKRPRRPVKFAVFYGFAPQMTQNHGVQAASAVARHFVRRLQVKNRRIGRFSAL
jgi:hypothetical protein